MFYFYIVLKQNAYFVSGERLLNCVKPQHEKGMKHSS